MRLLSILICVLSLSVSKAQEFSSAFYDSVLTLEKKIFEETDNERRTRFLLLKAGLYKQHGDFESSLHNLERIDLSNLTILSKDQVLYQKALVEYLLGKYFAARSDLNQISSPSKDTSSYLLRLSALILVELKNWNLSKEILLKTARIQKMADSTHLKELPIKTNEKIIARARTLSSVIPGAGQLYSGKPGRALTSFSLNVSLLSFGIWNISQGYYAFGFVSGISPFIKFYKGGIQYSEYLAIEYNQRENEKLRKLYRDQIFKIFP